MINNDSTRFCPFCGGYKLKVDSKTRTVNRMFDKFGIVHVTEFTTSIRCNKCHSRGPTVSGTVCLNYSDYLRLKGHVNNLYESYDNIKEVAIKRWNNRLFELH